MNHGTDRPLLTAYHEAGHAVMAHLLGLTVSQVALGGTTGEAGSCHTLRFGGRPGPAGGRALEEELLVALAGTVAEWIASGAPGWDEDSGDVERAVRLALRLTGDCEAAHRLVLEARDRVRAVLSRHWDAVERLARLLVRERRLGRRRLARVLGAALARHRPVPAAAR